MELYKFLEAVVKNVFNFIMRSERFEFDMTYNIVNHDFYVRFVNLQNIGLCRK